MLLPLLLVAVQAINPTSRVTPGPPRPTTWVAFSADLRIDHETRPTAFGRFVQDDHGCSRRETVHPDGSLMVVIQNFDNETFYQLIRGNWTSRPMRLVPGIPRRAPVRPLTRKLPPIEGYEAFLSVSEVKSPRGNFTREAVILPGLNSFEAVSRMGNGETITAQNIRRGAPDHAEFLPPSGAAVAASQEFGGTMVFQGLSLRITYLANRQSEEITGMEEDPKPITTPGGEQFYIVARAVEGQKGMLRVRVMRNAERRGPGRVIGDVVEELIFPFTESARTTKLAENFSISLLRIGREQIR